MLRLTGRLGDGWLPSIGGSYLAEDDVPERQRVIDEAARRAGRDPERDRARGEPGARRFGGWLDAERIADLAERLRLEALLVSPPAEDPLDYIAALGETAAELHA